jgi:hypothetical protein
LSFRDIIAEKNKKKTQKIETKNPKTEKAVFVNKKKVFIGGSFCLCGRVKPPLLSL